MRSELRDDLVVVLNFGSKLDQLALGAFAQLHCIAQPHQSHSPTGTIARVHSRRSEAAHDLRSFRSLIAAVRFGLQSQFGAERNVAPLKTARASSAYARQPPALAHALLLDHAGAEQPLPTKRAVMPAHVVVQLIARQAAEHV